jgi:hypothetical protein
VYVDDIIVIGNDDSTIFFIISKLQYEFVMKDLGDLSYFLGIEVARDHTGCIYVNLNISLIYLIVLIWSVLDLTRPLHFWFKDVKI